MYYFYLVFRECNEAISNLAVGESASGGEDLFSDSSQDTMSDEMLAQMLQLQFDQEYDRNLGKEEAKYNGSSKGLHINSQYLT